MAYRHNINFVDGLENYKLSCTEAKSIMSHGQDSGNPMNMPVYTPPPALANPVHPGIIPRNTKLVSIIKKHDNFTTAIGQDLQIIGNDPNEDFDNITPVLKATFAGLNVKLKSKLYGADGLHFESKRGTETEFTPLIEVMKGSYTDKRPNLVAGVQETRQYRCMLLANEELVGQMSMVVSVLVTI